MAKAAFTSPRHTIECEYICDAVTFGNIECVHWARNEAPFKYVCDADNMKTQTDGANCLKSERVCA
eukprot:7806864-Lingulodinium_polyedra.AAC.1